MEIISNVGVFDYERHKLCDLYDSQVNLIGQAYDIQHIQLQDGVNQLTFNLPYMIDKEMNFRWKYLKSEYLIRLYRGGKYEWFVAQKPTKKKSGKEVFGSVVCNATPILLKTKNIYMEFDDENGIGTMPYLMRQILAGTGWSLDEDHSDVIYEDDGTTEKIRSLNNDGGKTGSLGLINNVCNLFHCRPVYDTDKQKVTMLDMKHRDMIFEAEVGKNLDALSVTYNSDDIVTRLYVEGEYGDHGYIGIDDVNPTGLTYILNFDYYREIGLFSASHEAALATYLEDIGAVTRRMKNLQAEINRYDDNANTLIGQCNLTVYYVSGGFVNPTFIYGNPTDAQKTLFVGDEVVVMNSNGTHRYETILTTPGALIQSGDYAIAKFGTKASGSIGAKEVQVEAKEKEIAQLERKIAATTKPDKIAEYEAEIAQLQSEIQTILTETNGLYDQMASLMRTDGILDRIKTLENSMSVLEYQQDEIEADFIVAMGNMLRDGCWQNNNYIVGQEEALFADAKVRSDIMARPEASYTFDYIRMVQDFGVPIDDIKINAIVRTNDDELDVHENLFVTKITTGIDREDFGNIDVSNKDFTLSTNDLGSLLSRMSQLADLIDQRNQIYQRAEAISKSGTFFADRLNGMIDVTKNQILSTVSNWYTDDNGNLVFESVDGGSAMMLSGAGFMIADTKTEDGDWNWRTSATGHGLNADEIVAGFLSADRIEAGSIEVNKVAPNFGSNLVITGNPIITDSASAFDPTQDYYTNDVVQYQNNIYIFTSDHPAGAWDYDDVTQTSVVTQLEMMPDRIVSIVSSKGYSRTFIQLTDPALDSSKQVRDADYWIVAESEDVESVVWRDVKENKWGELRDITWGVLGGYSKMYVRNHGEWMLVYDRSFEPVVYTRIEQTQEKIELEAVRAISAEEQLSARITLTAEQIQLEVQRATEAEGKLSSRITVNADNITAEVTRATGVENSLSGRITVNADNITAEVTRATTAEDDLSGRITVNADNISAEVTRATGVESGIKTTLALDSSGKITLSSTNFSKLGDTTSGVYITPTTIEIESAGTLKVNSSGTMSIESGGDFVVKSGGDFDINSGGTMTVKSGGSLSVSSGGTFTITSTNFNIDASGNVSMTGTIKATAGSIGPWNIGSSSLYNGKNSYDSMNAGVYLGTNGLALGPGARKTEIGAASDSDVQQYGLHDTSIYYRTPTHDWYWDGSSWNICESDDDYIMYTAPLKINENGQITAMNIRVSDGITFVDSAGYSVKLDASKLADGSISLLQMGRDSVDTNQLCTASVTYNCCSQGTGSVRSMLTNGQASYDALYSMVQGALNSGDLYLRSVNTGDITVGINNGTRYALSYYDVKTTGGTTIKVLGHA